MIRFKCPNCAKEISVKDELAGRKGKCPGCGHVLIVPNASEADKKDRWAPAIIPKHSSTAVSPLPPPVAPSPPAAHVQTVDVPATPAYSPSATIHTPATAIQVNVNQSFASHSLGVSSLVLGILSFFVCWIPFVGLPLSGLGLILGVSGLVMAVARRGSGIGYSIAGSAVSSLGLLLAFGFMMVLSGMFHAVDSAVNELNKKQQAIPVVQATPAEPPQPETDSDTASTPATAANAITGLPPAANPTPPSPKPSGPVWTRADTPLKLGNVQLRVTKVTMGKVPLHRKIGDTEGVSQEELLAVWLEVTNISERKKIDYRGWMGDFSSLSGITAELRDDVDNRYRAIDFSATLEVKGMETNTSIYPGKSINDAVVFEKPIEGVEYLRLKLAAKGCGEDGEFRLEIPKSMIQSE